MHRVLIVAAMAVIGFAALAHAAEVATEAEEQAAQATQAVQTVEAAAVAASAAVPAEATRSEGVLRLCIGPARLSFGGAPFTRIAFGGEGCGRASLGVVGLRIIDLNEARELAPSSPLLIDADEDEALDQDTQGALVGGAVRAPA